MSVGVLVVGSSLLSACAPIPPAPPEYTYRPYMPPPSSYHPPVRQPEAMPKPSVPPVARTMPMPEQTSLKPEVLQVPDEADTTDTQESASDITESRPRKTYQSSAPTQILVKQAQEEAAKGKLSMAEATIERALRIEPDNPGLWLKLSELKRQQGDIAQAEAMAAKATYYQESLN